MPIITAQRKRQRMLTGVMAGVIAVTGIVLYLGVFREGGPPKTTGSSGAGLPDSLVIPQGFVLDTDILKQERFRRLVPYTTISGGGETGRDNPFIPYTVNPPQVVEEVATSTNATSTQE